MNVVERTRVPLDDVAEAATVTVEEPIGVPGSPPPPPDPDPPPQLMIGVTEIAISSAASIDQRSRFGAAPRNRTPANASPEVAHQFVPGSAEVCGAVVEIVSVV